MADTYFHLASLFEDAVKQMYPEVPEPKAVEIAWDAAFEADEAAKRYLNDATTPLTSALREYEERE